MGIGRFGDIPLAVVRIGQHIEKFVGQGGEIYFDAELFADGGEGFGMTDCLIGVGCQTFVEAAFGVAEEFGAALLVFGDE